MAPASRLLSLLALLQARRDWSGPELAGRLAVSERTIRRDVERLRELGYPVESVSGPVGGYRLRSGTAMPPLLLDEAEATAIAVALRTAANSGVSGIEETSVRALVKLEQVLPLHLRRRVRALHASTAVPPAFGGARVDAQTLTVVAATCRDCERLRFTYEARGGARSRRDVEPHTIVNLGRRWYLVAWDRGRQGWRTFRLDRVTRPFPAGTRFAARPLPAEDAAAYVGRAIATMRNRYEAHLTLHVSAEEAARLPAARWGEIAPIDDEHCTYRTGDDDLDWLAMRLVAIGVDFVVHEPPELVVHLAAWADRLRRATA